MTATVITIIPQTVEGHPSGNYDGSSLDWLSGPVQAAEYYHTSSIQTIFFNLRDFLGLIKIEATQSTEAASNDVWVEIASFGSLPPDGPITTNFPATRVGNYTWLRAQVENFTQGTIVAVTVEYL